MENQHQRGSAGQVLAQQQSRGVCRICNKLKAMDICNNNSSSISAGIMGGSKPGAPVRTGGLASSTYGRYL